MEVSAESVRARELKRLSGSQMVHIVCLAAHVSGGFKSHSVRGPGLISKGGGSSSPAEVRKGLREHFGGQGVHREVVIKGSHP